MGNQQSGSVVERKQGVKKQQSGARAKELKKDKKKSLAKKVISKVTQAATANKQAVVDDVMVGRVLLPAHFTPDVYDLTIDTNMSGNFRYDGNVKISGEVLESGLKSLTVHAQELNIETAEFKSDAVDSDSVPMVSLSYDVQWSTVTLYFKDEIAKGPGVLEISFSGKHNNQMAGFYRSACKDRQGNDAVLLCTQFEAVDARRCFPCIDEPAAKAVFKPTLIIPDGQTALGNMPVESSTLLDDGKRRKVVFGETPKMSTYLLAFVVGDFDFVEQSTEHGVMIRVYTPPGLKEQGEFALDVAAKALDIYDDMFKQPYPLPKLDMVAVPDFAAGAMENWGLVTYRDVALLIDGERASSTQKQRVATVVAHELAHQWFGNLVTMGWWSSLWLNEGFASWMQHHCVDEIFPEWTMWDQFVMETQNGALTLDSLQSSHPIEVPIKHAQEVLDVFDGISYMKGASVVRLIYSYLGKDNFYKGLQSYMAKYKYSNAETTDLWKAWEKVSDLPVTKVMASWTSQMGCPVMVIKSAKWSDSCATCTFEVEQKWFLGDGSEPAESKDKLWSIPIMVTMGGNGGKVVNLGIFDTRTAKIVVPVEGKKKTWIKFNGQQHIPMLVNYDAVAEECMPLFNEAILSKEMVVTDRVGILRDSYALTRAGAQDATNLIKLLAAYNSEDSMPVISAMEAVLGGLGKVLSNIEEMKEPFVAFGASLIASPCSKIGWEASSEDGHLTSLMRSSLVRMQASFMVHDPKVVKQAQDRFESWASDPVKNHGDLPSEIKTALIKIALANAKDDSTFERCIDIVEQAETTQEKKEVYLALGAVHTAELKTRTLEWATHGALRLQDFSQPIAAVSASKDGLEITWAYFKDNFDRLIDMIRTASPWLLAGLVIASAAGFASEERAAEIEKFFVDHNEHPIPLIKRKIDQLVEATRANAAFLNNLKKSQGLGNELEKSI